MKSNEKIKVSPMTTATYLFKLKDDDLISRKTLNFIQNIIFSFWAKWELFLKPWSLKGGMR